MSATEAIALLQAVGRTDVTIGAIQAELERHRDELEGDDDLRTLTVQVRYNRATGLPRTVIVSRESEHDYARDA